MAKQMIYTARNIKADEALRIGLVNAVYTQEELMPAAEKMAAGIAKNAPGKVSSLRKTSFPFLPKASPSAFVRLLISPMSAPATKDFCPAPVKIRHLTSSRFTASSVWSSSSNTVEFNAFNAFSRLYQDLFRQRRIRTARSWFGNHPRIRRHPETGTGKRPVMMNES
mgnify:CR=1 FL=1